MRSLVSLFGIVAFTIAMIIAIPTMWSVQHVVSPDGFAEAASQAAEQREVQEYFADQIAQEATQAVDLPIAGTAVKPLATQYTQSPEFVADFTEIARQQHAWLFESPKPDTSLHEMDLNITPMVNQALAKGPVPVRVDQEITIAVDQNRLTAGSMEKTGQQLTLAAWISAAVAVAAGLLALIAARRRVVAVAWLGIGAFAAGVVGVLISKYLLRSASDSVSASELSTQQTVRVVAEDVLGGLTTTSWIVAVLGLIVALLGIVGVVVTGRRSTP